MATISQLTDEEMNFIKFTLLNFKVSPEILRRFFDTTFPPRQLVQIINNNMREILNLNNRGIITTTQFILLRGIQGTVWPSNLPMMPITATSSKDFDLTLMICLMRNLGGVARPINGWDQLPHPNDTSPGAHLTTLKLYRNEMAHTTDSSMDKKKFMDKWNQVEKALIFLNNGQKPQEVTDILNLDIDGEKAKQEFLECEKERQQLESDFRHYRHGNLPRNIADSNARFVETWHTDDKRFYETKGTKRICDMVRDYNCVLVTSSSGSGKTAAIRHIALMLQSKDFEIISVETPADILKYQTDKKQIFLVDDVLGKYDLSPNLLEDWERINEKLISCLDAKLGSTKILCTLRNQVALNNRFKNASTILNKCVINLEDESITLSKQEKRKILLKHLEVDNLENEVTEEEVEMMCETNFAFPLLCKLVSNDEERFKNRITFFVRPWSKLQEEVEKINSENKKLYCTLVLCMLFNGKLEREILDVASTSHDEKIKKIMQTCELETSMSKIELYNIAQRAVGSYFSCNSNTLTFIHDALEETVGHHFSVHYPEVMFTECDIWFIRDRVYVDCEENEEENIFIIKEEELNKDCFKPLYDRLLHEIVTGKFSNVLMSRLIKNITFLRILTTIVEESTTISISYLLEKVSTERIKVKYELMRRDFQSVLKWELEPWIQSNEAFQDKHDAISRVIGAFGSRSTLMYWIVAFGCYEFFQCVWSKLSVNKKKYFLGKDKISLVFVKSFFPLAVLGGNKDIVTRLVSAGADVNCFSEYWETPLFIAAKAGNYDIALVLVQNGAKVNLRGWFGMKVPIIITSNQPKLTSMLLEHDLGQTELHEAVWHNDLEKLKSGIQTLNINSQTKSGWTPIFYAVALKNTEAAKILFNEFTPNDIDFVSVIGQNVLNKTLKQNVNIPDNNGITALHLAVISNDIDMLNILLANKAEVKVRDDYDRTPLHYAHSLRATNMLLAGQNNHFQRDLEVAETQDYVNKTMSTFRTMCCNLNLKSVFRVVCRDFVNMPDKEGNTPLHSVITSRFVEAERPDIMNVLLQNGADPLLYNDEDTTPFQLIKSEYDGSCLFDREIQSNKNASKILTLILFILIILSMVLPIIFISFYSEKNGFCSVDQFKHLNQSGLIHFVQEKSTRLDVSLTIVLFVLLSTSPFTTNIFTFLMPVEIFFTSMRCIFFLISFLFEYNANEQKIIFHSVCGILCIIFLQFLTYCYALILYAFRSKRSYGFLYLSILCLICIFLFGLFMYLRFVFPDNNNLLNITVSNCNELKFTYIICVGKDYNVTFDNGPYLNVNCITDLNNTVYSGTLKVEPESIWSDNCYKYVLFINFLFHAVCVYYLRRVLISKPFKILKPLLFFLSLFYYNRIFLLTVLVGIITVVYLSNVSEI